jgi:hypothetical protein
VFNTAGAFLPMGIQKIISGGQTGVDRAALDVALELRISCGGWCPKGRTAEDGSVAPRYPLKETSSEDYAQRTTWNVRDSDGTLILTPGEPTGGTAQTVDDAVRLNKPYLVIDLARPYRVSTVLEWATAHHVRVLNIAGPRESKSPGVYRDASDFLRELFHHTDQNPVTSR